MFFRGAGWDNKTEPLLTRGLLPSQNKAPGYEDQCDAITARGPLEMQREVLLSTRAPGCTNVQHFRMPIADFRLPIDL
jgi:hypothetical protein